MEKLPSSSKQCDSSTQTCAAGKLSLSYGCLDEEQFVRYTGLKRNRFDVLYAFLNQTGTSNFDIYLSKRDQLILTLLKYKQNIIFSIIGDIYGLPLLTTRKIFVHWTLIMNAAFKAVHWWPLRYQNRNAYTIILNCAEVKTNQSIKNLEPNQALFSHAKNQNTLKYLVGIDQKGTVIYCSDVYCGSVNDRFIVTDCGILDKLTEGDTVLADRSFDIGDILENKGITLNVPPLQRDKCETKPQEVLEAKRLGNRRKLVERVIRLGKYNKILSNTIPGHLWPNANEVIYVSNMLNNFNN